MALREHPERYEKSLYRGNFWSRKNVLTRNAIRVTIQLGKRGADFIKLGHWIRSFFKFNLISAIWGFALLIQVQSMLNIYRIVRITSWSFSTVKIVIMILNISVLIASTMAIYLAMKRYFNQGKLRYLMVLTWIPYYVIFSMIFSYLFPIIYGGDKPAPVLGLLLLVGYPIYPFYIAFISYIATSVEVDS